MDKSKWEYKKLGDICKSINAGGTPSRGNSAYWNGDIPWVKIKDMNSKYVNSTEEFITNEGLNNSSAKLFEPGTILYSIFATIGAASILEIPATTNQAIAGIVLGDGCNRDFYYYYLAFLKSHFENISKGVAQNNINLSVLRNQKVIVPPLDDQQRIVAELDCLNEMIALKQEQLKEFDKLAQSIFYDMFGDPVINEKGWDKCCLEEVLTNLRYGTSTPPQFSENGYKFIRATNIKNGCISESNMFFISEKEAAMLEKCRLSKYDMIIVRSGANAGDVCRIGEEYSGHYAGYDIIFSINPNKADTIFLNSLMNNGVFVSSVIKPLTRRAAQPHLNANQAKGMRVICPPLALQQQFAEKIQAIEAQKELVKQSIAETQQLLDSRMDYYFN